MAVGRNLFFLGAGEQATVTVLRYCATDARGVIPPALMLRGHSASGGGTWKSDGGGGVEYVQALQKHHGHPIDSERGTPPPSDAAAQPQPGKAMLVCRLLMLLLFAVASFSGGYWLHWALEDSQQHLTNELDDESIASWRAQLAQAEARINAAEHRTVEAEVMAQHEAPAAQERALADLNALRDAAIVAESHRDDAIKAYLKLQVEADTLERQLAAAKKQLAACNCPDEITGITAADSVPGDIASAPPEKDSAQEGGEIVSEAEDTTGGLPPASCLDVQDNCEALKKRCFDGKHPPSFEKVDCCRTCWPLRSQ